MEKIVQLRKEVKDDNNNVVAVIETFLEGDGATPVIQAMGAPASNIIGYKDNGEPIIQESQDILIENAKRELMAAAIKEQKKLCVENGVDPDLVNIIGLEKKERNKNE